MLDHDLIRTALAASVCPGDLFADLFAEQTSTAVYEIDGGELADVQRRELRGVSLRRAGASHSRLAHTDELTEAGLRGLVESLRGGFPPPAPGRADACAPDAPPLVGEETLAALIEVARASAAEAQRWGGPRIRARATARMVRRTVLVGRSDGPIRQEQRDYVSVRTEAIAQEERKLRTGRRSLGAAQVDQLSAGQRHLLLAREAAEAALLRLESVAPPSGEMAVILGPGGPATLLHEACGHALEIDLARHPASAYHGRLGQRVASPLVTLLDDPQAAPDVPVYGFDDEGEPAQPTLLIERGVLRGYLYDRRSALVDGHAPNGHARRLSYAYPPLPRMSATYVAPGQHTPDEIIAATPRGIYVQSIGGGDTDMGSGRFNLQIDEGFLIEGGRLTAPIRGGVLSGVGPEVLMAIDRVGGDCQFLHHCYVCNKLDQFPLLVSLGQPTLRVARLSVWGG